MIPCYHESGRLPPFLRQLCARLETLSFPITLQVADDGSGAEELAKLRPLVEEMRAKHPGLVCDLLALSHQGKGGTLLRAWTAAPSSASHYAFADADGAVAPDEIGRVLQGYFARPQLDAARCVFAIRKGTPWTTIKRHPLRRLLGLAYYRLVRFILNSEVYDPSCGFKILSRSFWDTCGHLLTEKEWALDIEILARIGHHGFPLEQVPVNWEEKGGSKIGRADLWQTLRQVIQIKQRSKFWHLDPA